MYVFYSSQSTSQNWVTFCGISFGSNPQKTPMRLRYTSFRVLGHIILIIHFENSVYSDICYTTTTPLQHKKCSIKNEKFGYLSRQKSSIHLKLSFLFWGEFSFKIYVLFSFQIKLHFKSHNLMLTEASVLHRVVSFIWVAYPRQFRTSDNKSTIWLWIPGVPESSSLGPF